jgi:hypothetical protein
MNAVQLEPLISTHLPGKIFLFFSLYLKKLWTGLGIAHLPSNHKALSSNPSTTTNKTHKRKAMVLPMQSSHTNALFQAPSVECFFLLEPQKPVLGWFGAVSWEFLLPFLDSPR